MDKNSIATVQDLNVFCENIKNHFSDVIKSKINPLKEFYTPKEFGAKINRPYSTVVYMCNMGKSKAVQESPNCSRVIHS